jgi:transmembrane sensor
VPGISQKQELFNRLLAGNLTEKEADELIQWLGENEQDPLSIELILNQLKTTGRREDVDPEIVSKLEARLPLIFNEAKRRQVPVIPIRKRWLPYVAAAILLAGIFTTIMLIDNNASTISNGNFSHIKEEILPGKEGAVLTLEDGSKLVLDSMGNGIVTTQNGTTIELRNGQLVYNSSKKITNDEVGYNTMSTPKGRQFQLVLPDGSQVWLNAASSIRYPTVFTGKERKVEITGEAYFEVAHNRSSPFKVKINENTEIEVLGTHFNINSYSNEESINTTLLEGSVKVNDRSGSIVLRPGQQAKVSGNEKTKILSEVDVEKVMAWKNGVFNFEDATLQEVMRQLERWYDIEVVYEKNIPKLEFFGKMGKDLSLASVLNGLEKSKVHFRMEEGRRLVVLP